MSLLSATHVSQSFGAVDVFKNLSVSLPNDGKIGLIGPNGVGKTTLLLILAGLSQPTTGGVSLARGRRVGYLRQEAVEAFAARESTVYAEMLTVFAGVIAQQERLHELEAAMATEALSEELLEAYSTERESFEQAGGYDYELRIQQTLQGLGFGKSQWETPIAHLSGGQKTRALLARLLLEQPDLLILDEPTNHLDVEAVEWLETTLRLWPGALLIVSHDRYFLDNVVNTIWDMSRLGLEVYRGNYSAYLRQREERWERMQLVFEEEKARLLREIDFVKRNIARASTNARAVGLLRRLSRDLVLIDHFGIQGLRNGMSWSETGLHAVPLGADEALRRINALESPVSHLPRLRVNLNVTHQSGATVLRTKRLRVGYPDTSLFTSPDLDLQSGECAALIGPNGAGKTTFLKTLLQQLPPLAGEVRLGHNVKVGYFAQAASRDGLNPDSTVLDELQRHKTMPPGRARSYLAQYLFRGDDVFKPISALSGGERARLALARLALDGANLLLLDEPTNHLDIPAQEVLQEVLEHFEGTLLLVSHDRYLVDRLATQIWELRDGHLCVFKGRYQEYTTRRTMPDEPRLAKRKRSSTGMTVYNH